MLSARIADVELIIRLTLGFVFFGSALTKMRDPGAFVRGVLNYEVLPRPVAQLVGRVLPALELVTALLLVSGFFLPIAAGLAALLLISFVIALVINAARGRDVPCHCFGANSTSRIGWHSVLRAAILLLPSLWLLLQMAVGESPQGSRPRDALIPMVAIAAIMALTYSLCSEGIEFIVGTRHKGARSK